MLWTDIHFFFLWFLRSLSLPPFPPYKSSISPVPTTFFFLPLLALVRVANLLIPVPIRSSPSRKKLRFSTSPWRLLLLRLPLLLRRLRPRWTSNRYNKTRSRSRSSSSSSFNLRTPRRKSAYTRQSSSTSSVAPRQSSSRTIMALALSWLSVTSPSLAFSLSLSLSSTPPYLRVSRVSPFSGSELMFMYFI